MVSLVVSSQFVISNGFKINGGKFQTVVNDDELWEKFKDFYFTYYKTDDQLNQLREPILRIKILDLLLYLFNVYFIRDENYSKDPKMNKLLEYLNANYTEKISLDFLSEQFHYNKCYLTSVFKKNFGCTITEYLNRNRCIYADSLLKTTELRIADIAEMCGFGTVTNFRKVYKRIRNDTPTAVREKHKNIDAYIGTPKIKREES